MINGRDGKASLIVSYDVDDAWLWSLPVSDAFAVDSCGGVLLRKITVIEVLCFHVTVLLSTIHVYSESTRLQ